MQYAQHPQSQVVQTSWAVLALIYGEYPDVEVIKKACGLLMSRQKEDGRWEQEDTEGIFNKNCAIDYPGTFILLLLFLPCSLWSASSSFTGSLFCLTMFLSCRFLKSWDRSLTTSVQIHFLYLGFRQSRQVSQPIIDQREK